MQNVFNINNESTKEEFNAASSEMWEFLYGKWTWKQGMLPFEPCDILKIELPERPELAKIWEEVVVAARKAVDDLRYSTSESFDIDYWHFGDSKSVAAEKQKVVDAIAERKIKEEKAVALMAEVEQVEMAGGRAISDEWFSRTTYIKNFNERRGSLISLHTEIGETLIAKAAKKAERKEARLAAKAVVA